MIQEIIYNRLWLIYCHKYRQGSTLLQKTESYMLHFIAMSTATYIEHGVFALQEKCYIGIEAMLYFLSRLRWKLVNFSDRLLSVSRLSVNFLHVYLLHQKLWVSFNQIGTNHLWVKGIHLFKWRAMPLSKGR